jgi:hypothetical protein
MIIEEEFFSFVQGLSSTPGFYFGSDNNRFDRLQAFLFGIGWGHDMLVTDREHWAEIFIMFQKWLPERLSGNPDAALWYCTLMKESEDDQTMAYQRFFEYFELYLREYNAKLDSQKFPEKSSQGSDSSL